MKPGQLLPQQDAAISLPASLFKRITSANVGVFFGLYKNATLFPVDGEKADNSASRRTQVGSQVLAATVGQNVSLQNLAQTESVTVVLRLQYKEGTVSLITTHNGMYCLCALSKVYITLTDIVHT